MKHLYFVRHGQTEWNAISRMQGQWNSDLNDLGKEQAHTNGKLLATLNVEAIFASPLDRTRQTAGIINQYLNKDIVFDERIMEWDCGDWSGHLYKEVQHKWPEHWAALEADRFNYRGPNCENYPDMINRSKPFLDEIQSRPEENIAVVSHGMIGKAMVAQLLNLGEDETLGLHQANDEVFKVKLNNGTVEVEHFVAGKGPVPGIVVREKT